MPSTVSTNLSRKQNSMQATSSNSLVEESRRSGIAGQNNSYYSFHCGRQCESGIAAASYYSDQSNNMALNSFNYNQCHNIMDLQDHDDVNDGMILNQNLDDSDSSDTQSNINSEISSDDGSDTEQKKLNKDIPARSYIPASQSDVLKEYRHMKDLKDYNRSPGRRRDNNGNVDNMNRPAKFVPHDTRFIYNEIHKNIHENRRRQKGSPDSDSDNDSIFDSNYLLDNNKFNDPKKLNNRYRITASSDSSCCSASSCCCWILLIFVLFIGGGYYLYSSLSTPEGVQQANNEGGVMKWIASFGTLMSVFSVIKEVFGNSGGGNNGPGGGPRPVGGGGGPQPVGGGGQQGVVPPAAPQGPV